MRFLTIFTPAKRSAGPPGPEHMAQMGKLAKAETKAGVLITTGGLVPGAARVRRTDDEITVVDGPPTQPIEGFAILEAGSTEECIEACRRFLKVAGDGVTEIHQIMG